MAIPRFFKYFIKKIPFDRQVTSPEAPSYVSSLSIEINALAHTIAQIVFAYGTIDERKQNTKRAQQIRDRLEYVANTRYELLEQEFFEVLSTKIIEIVQAVNPVDTIVLELDGTAPAAKIVQQRQRRYRGATAEESPKFNSDAITPGTDFMQRLDAYLRSFIDVQKGQGPRKRGEVPKAVAWHQKVIYSSHLVPGEGEHKIMDLMRAGAYNTASTGAHILHGADADLILLTSMSPLQNMVIMREEQDPEPGAEELEFIYVENFKLYITEELKGAETAVHDFVVLTFFIGNDFLPHSPAFSGDMFNTIQALMGAYRATGLPLTTDGDINWDNMRQFCIQLARSEEELLRRQSTDTKVHPLSVFSHVKEVGSFNFKIGRDDWYSNALGIRTTDDRDFEIIRRLMGAGVMTQITNEQLIRLVTDYLIGIRWVYRYYTGGMANVDVYWFYQSYYTPLLSNVAWTVRQMSGLDLEQYASVVDPKLTVEGGMEAIDPVSQLLAVIPPQSAYLIPPEVRGLVVEESSISDFYPVEYVSDIGGVVKTYKDKGIALLPFVDFRRLGLALETTSFTASRARLYEEAGNEVWAADEIRIAKFEELRKNRELARRIEDENYRALYPSRGRGSRGRPERPDRPPGRGGFGRGGSERPPGRGLSASSQGAAAPARDEGEAPRPPRPPRASRDQPRGDFQGGRGGFRGDRGGFRGGRGDFRGNRGGFRGDFRGGRGGPRGGPPSQTGLQRGPLSQGVLQPGPAPTRAPILATIGSAPTRTPLFSQQTR